MEKTGLASASAALYLCMLSVWICLSVCLSKQGWIEGRVCGGRKIRSLAIVCYAMLCCAVQSSAVPVNGQ